MGNKALNKKALSDALARRLPAYYRHVCIMLAEGKQTVTSGELAKRVGNTSAQVRQDFFTCGGVENYHPDTLKNWLSDLLGIKEEHHMVVVGAGNLGRAIISFKDFNNDGFFIDAVFDNNLMLDGMQVCGIPVLNVATLDEYLAANRTDIVVIATPANVAEDILDKAIRGGVKGVWNFAPVDLRSNEAIEVQNVHLSDSLLTLSFRINEKEHWKSEN
ncbi:MAG: redox-sensing transcriptional repressor Rex [Oscillospiraceae bacterium]|nr:redox-sensing transcriptional repressor Rex [Oscillospiraceae bacterium]